MHCQFSNSLLQNDASCAFVILIIEPERYAIFETDTYFIVEKCIMSLSICHCSLFMYNKGVEVILLHLFRGNFQTLDFFL